MSCQQASRFITNNCNNILNNNSNNNNNNSNIIKANRSLTRVVNQEDPYVFTESVPTTPPILFNTQKTRTRLNDITSSLTTTTTLSVGKLLQQQQLPLITETNGKLAESTTNVIKTQASLVATSTTTTTTPTTVKSVTQSLTTQAAAAAVHAHAHAQLHSEQTSNNNKKLTNVCIVRPQLQQQQPHHHNQHYHNFHQQLQQQHSISSSYAEDLKSISPPPPLYTPPTPSLWQTPLLLETTTATPASVQVANVAPQPTVITTQSDVGLPNGMACVTPPTLQSVGSTTTTMSPSSLTTTAMAKVAPIIVHHQQHHHPILTTTTPPASPPAAASLQNLNQCLPPSKFHNHTLAQHIQKVECLKKSKKLNQQQQQQQQMLDTSLSSCNESVTTVRSTSTHQQPPTTAAVSLPSSLDCQSPVKHSETEDLNEIPVNVIFRMALVPQQQQQKNDVKKTTPANNNATLAATTQTHQLKTNLNKKCSIPASKTTTTPAIATATANLIVKQHKQINSSSIQQQQQQKHHNTTTKPVLKLSPLDHDPEHQQQTHHQVSNIKQSLEPLMKANEKPPSNTKPKYSTTHTLNKSRKLNSTLANLNCDYLPYNWQMGCSTTKGAVAIVKMSQHNLDLDITPLASAAGLPYCRQQYWLNFYEYGKSSQDFSTDKPIQRSSARDERISLYKQQLRRQAMQLLSTRSLQKLPLQLARRRLLCVDRLLRKYQHNQTDDKKQLPAIVKRCCAATGCNAYTLEMAAHCQQHIVHNAAQHVFLPCTAKFADNTQCRVPVFDITHDLPLCMEHARKRDAYNRLLYEQRPRKISTVPTSVETANDGSVVTGGGAAAAFILKTQNYQKPQPQHQKHNLKQFQPNNNTKNNNKRPMLVNQQQSRKRKLNNGVGGGSTGGGVSNPVGRPQKRLKKTAETAAKTTATTTQSNTNHQMPRLTSTNLKRKSSTTSLESIATSNSQHSTTSSTSQQQQQQQQHPQQQPKLYGLNSSLNAAAASAVTATTSLPPPALAPLSGGLMVGHQGLPQHLFSFGHDNHHPFNNNNNNNINDKHSFNTSASSTTPTELKDLISQFSFVTHKNHQHHHNHNHGIEATDLLNTNSNSNFTSSAMGSTTSLPTADDFLTQDMLSICENSSASSADTGLGGLSDPELMLGGPEDDIPLGDTHLLEEHDLANVLNSLPEDAFKELFATVHQDESDEIERAIELADKHLKTLQQTIGSELGDFLDFSDDMLMDSDMCNASTVSANSILDGSALFVGGGGLSSRNTTTLGGAGGLVQT